MKSHTLIKFMLCMVFMFPTALSADALMSVKTVNNDTRQYVVTPGEVVEYEFAIINSGDVKGGVKLEIKGADMRQEIEIDETLFEGLTIDEDFDFSTLPTFGISNTYTDKGLALWVKGIKDLYKVDAKDMKIVEVKFEIPEDAEEYSVLGGQVLATQVSIDEDESGSVMGSSVSTAVGKNLQFYVLPQDIVNKIRKIEEEKMELKEKALNPGNAQPYGFYIILAVIALATLIWMFFPNNKKK